MRNQLDCSLVMILRYKLKSLTRRFTSIELYCIFILLCDTINYFYSNPILLIAPKILLLGFLIVNTNTMHLHIFSGVLILLTLLQSFANIDVENLISNLGLTIKTLLFFYCMEYLFCKRLFISTTGMKIVYGYFLFNIALTWLGIGLTNYGRLPSGVPIGSKGIYQSGNEFGIAAFFIIMLTIIYKKPNLMNDLIMIVVGISIATKVSLVGASLVLLRRIGLILLKLKIFGVLIIIVVFTYIVLPYLIDYAVTRFSEDLRKSESILEFILSGRMARITYSLGLFLNSDMLHLLFGYSFSCVVSEECTLLSFVENDLMDYLFIYGFFIFTFIVYNIGYQFLRAVKTDKLFFVSLLLLYGISLTGGHVLYNALFPTLLLLILRKEEKR